MTHEKSKKQLKKRVDIQVSFLTAVFTLISSLSIWGICYSITYSDTINSLKQRVGIIYERVDKTLNMHTFHGIDNKNDTKTIGYEEARIMLHSLRNTTGASYIFTVKADEDGRIVYVIDGMTMSDEQYSAPGTYLEEELTANAQKALDGEIVLPEEIYNTTWGKFYWAFYPAEWNGEIVGAIGIAFEAEAPYHTYMLLAFAVPVICLVCCAVATYISFLAFRRISNPNYKDIYNTDILTKLKNRNAFEVDINNLNAGGDFEGRAVLSIDLNNLKKVNDKYGHAAGDQYIKAAASILNTYAIKGAVPYRTGGDEFVVLVDYSTKEVIKEWINNLHSIMREYKQGEELWCSFSIGYAFYDSKHDSDLLDTYKRADFEMYRNKQIQKKTQRISKSVGIDV